MSRCPSLQQLEHYLEEQLGDAEQQSISLHLGTCGSCQSVLEHLTQDASVDSLSPRSRRGDATGSPQPAFLDPLKRNVPVVHAAPGGEYDLILPSLPLSAVKAGPGAAVIPTVAGYQIVEELGRGGMGVVYKARQESLARLVALKMILAADHAGPRGRVRFRQEAEAVARLRHPNIVQIYDIGESERSPYIALEFVEGGSLAARLRGDPQPVLWTARLIETVARAVHFAHQHGIVHRDLKPANILLQESGIRSQESGVRSQESDNRGQTPGDSCLLTPDSCLLTPDSWIPKITDFGLAKRLDEQSSRTQSGEVVGTPSYMAPEQAGENKRIGPATDVYALGAILYELLTGRPPFKGATALDTVVQVLHEEPVRPGRLRPQLPRDLETICLKCLEKEPARRYGSARELADDLQHFRHGKPIQARPVGLAERGWKWAQRRPVTALLLAALIVSGVLGFAGVTWQWQEAALARDAALDARGVAVAERKRARAALYYSRIAQSQLQWRVNDIAGAARSLEKCLPLAGQEDRRGWEWYFLQNQFHTDLFTLSHRGGAPGGAVAYRPDGRWIASVVGGRPAGPGAKAAEVRIWDAVSGDLVHLLPAPAPVHRLVFRPDGRRIALAATDGTVRIWDAVTRKELLRPGHHNDVVAGLAFSPDGRFLASAGWDRAVKVWDTTTGRVTQLSPGHTDRVQSVAFHPDGRRLASAGWDGSVKIWNTHTSKEITTLLGHTSAVFGVAFSPDGELLASAGSNGNVKIWDVAHGRVVQSLTGQTGAVLAIAFNPDSRSLGYAGGDATVRIWDIESGVERIVFRGHTAAVESLQFSPNGGRLASSSPGQGAVKVWDLTRHPERGTFARTRGRLQKVVRVRDLLRSPSAATPAQTGPDVEALAFRGDGRQLVSVTVGGKLQTWDVATGLLQSQRQLALSEELVSPAVLAAFSPRGERIAGRSREDDRLVRIWEVDSGIEVVCLRGHTLPVFCLRFSADGRQLVTCAWDTRGADRPHEVKVWEVGTGKELAALPGRGVVHNAGFSPDGRWLALAGPNGAVSLVDWAGPRKVIPVAGHKSHVASLVFSADGRWLATAGVEDRMVKVWDLEGLEGAAPSTPQAAHVLTAPSFVCDLAFSPDGRRLAGISRDLITMWDVATGHEVLTLRGAPQRHWDPAFNPRVTFSPDGKRLAGTNWDESISLWEAEVAVDAAAVARRQSARRQAAAARVVFWHLQEAEECLDHNNKPAARFHFQRLGAGLPPGPLQDRKERLAAQLGQRN
jgi:WD40 repeat protein/serine/threonine protein kinase